MKKRLGLLVILLAVMLCPGFVHAQDGVKGVNRVNISSSLSMVGGKSTKLTKLVIGSIVATSDASIKIIWIPVKNAKKYEVYRSTSAKGKYKKIATTKKTKYTDKKGKQLTTYYYKIRAVGKNAKKTIYSSYSKAMKKKVRKIAEKTAYAGDSLMVGLVNYGKIKENESQRVFAQVGITTSKYYQSDLLKQLLEYCPDRLYIMLGVNDMAGNPSESAMNTIISYYKAILESCIASNPNMEIFVLGVSPVGKKSTVSLSTINYYNTRMEKKLLALDNVYYYDLALELADEEGYLEDKYAASDGLHWTSKAYDTVLKAMKEFVKAY
jgi:lysophospholipase L1-like esterase